MMSRPRIFFSFGPALREPKLLGQAITLADGIRLNASHSEPAQRSADVALLRRVMAHQNRSIPILLDLQGPKWRLGSFSEPLELRQNCEFVLVQDGIEGIPLPHPELFKGAPLGQRWLLDDGKMEAVLIRNESNRLYFKSLSNGILHPRKGVHPLGLEMSGPALSPKDLEDLDWAVEENIENLALSFVRRPEDVLDLRRRVEALKGQQEIWTKIEHPSALEHLDELARISSGLLVARGDLGVELGVEKVPIAQRRVLEAGLRAGRPVMVASQLLENLYHSPQPTRTEVSDIAHMAWSGVESFLLTGETAAGPRPVECLECLSRILQDCQGFPSFTREKWACVGWADGLQRSE